MTATIRSQYEHLDKENLGDGLTESELYFWATQHGKENRVCQDAGHFEKYGWCRSCKNPLCPDTRWHCRCSAGKNQITPYRIRRRGNIGG